MKSPARPAQRSSVPEVRVRDANGAAWRADGGYVLYWMIAARRPLHNFGLQRAVELARERQVPLVVLEALRIGYRWASDRMHRFALDGMRDHARHFGARGVTYWPYVEPCAGAGRGLLAALAARACAVVTDEFPCFFLPAMVQAAARALDVRLEVVDSNGILPLASTARVFTTAHSFRAHLQKELRPHLSQVPAADPLARAGLRPLTSLPREVRARWPAAGEDLLERAGAGLARLDVDHGVPATLEVGGPNAGAARLRTFLQERLARYATDRNDVGDEAVSGLSSYLHWGHVGAHQVLAALAASGSWSLEGTSRTPRGGERSGWWGCDASTEAFLDQLVTWRELGFHFCHRRADYDRFESLPAWALATLQAHARDPRRPCYGRSELESAATHDALWNAAQRQLRREGRIHNYLRMLWGKKILEWSTTPREALEHMIELNNRYSIDGRDPNSYSGIFWTLGRFDRPWGPERPIYGSVRTMSSDNTRRKLDVDGYLERYGEPSLFGAVTDGRPAPGARSRKR